LLSTASISAIAALASHPEDVRQACADFGLAYVPVDPWDVDDPDKDGDPPLQWENSYLEAWHVTYATLEGCDRTDRMVAVRALHFTRRLAELCLVSRGEVAERQLLSLRKALADDGFYLTIGGDPLKVLDELAALATIAAVETSAIRAELRRLESALPNDPSVAIGRAKNLVEATAKAILAQHSRPVDSGLSVHALAVQAMDILGAHPRDAANEPSRRILGRLIAADTRPAYRGSTGPLRVAQPGRRWSWRHDGGNRGTSSWSPRGVGGPRVVRFYARSPDALRSPSPPAAVAVGRASIWPTRPGFPELRLPCPADYLQRSVRIAILRRRSPRSDFSSSSTGGTMGRLLASAEPRRNGLQLASVEHHRDQGASSRPPVGNCVRVDGPCGEVAE